MKLARMGNNGPLASYGVARRPNRVPDSGCPLRIREHYIRNLAGVTAVHHRFAAILLVLTKLSGLRRTIGFVIASHSPTGVFETGLRGCPPEKKPPQKHVAVMRLRQIPSIGPIRAALLVALLQTPHRFRTKRQLWDYRASPSRLMTGVSTATCAAKFNATGSASRCAA